MTTSMTTLNEMENTGNLWGVSEKLEDFLRKQGNSKMMIGLEIACKKCPK
jgi:hypothetical protein